MFTELGKVMQQCRDEVEEKIDGQIHGTAILSTTVVRLLERIESQIKLTERQILESLGNK